MNFSKRSTAPELMDDPNLEVAQLRLALKDLATVNKLLGGNKITIKALKKLIKQHPHKKRWKVVDVGCGDGEVVRQLALYFKNEPYDISFVGIDINKNCIARARQLSQGISNVSYSTQNIVAGDNTELKGDVILCTLTMHHFTDDELLLFVNQFKKLAAVGVIINDLQRSKVAYRLFQLFSGIFMKSSIAKYDGKISIARSFVREELENYSKQLALKDYSIHWKWAFRYVWVIRNL